MKNRIEVLCYDSKLKGLSNELTLVLSDTRELDMSQTSFSLYLHNQWTNIHKLSCAGKPQMRAIHTYVGCTKATTND